MSTVYVCHPYSDDPDWNKAKVRVLCRNIHLLGHVPVAPQLYLDQFLSERTEREAAMAMCLRLLSLCDELWVCAEHLSPGMQIEVAFAHDQNVPVMPFELAKQLLRSTPCES